MCDNLDKFPKKENIYQKFLNRLKSENASIKCKKCQTNDGFVLLQRKDVFCGQCLHEYCSHKFKATIGKSKAIRTGDRVLIAFSGGLNSSAMIDMIGEGLSEDQHRKLRFIPSLVYIDESVIITDESKEEKEKDFNKIKDLMLRTDWNCFVSSIEMTFRESDTDFYHKLNDNNIDYDSLTSIECRKEFVESFSSIKTLTSSQEFLKRMRYRLICDIAKNENYDKVFFGNNATNLSINLMSDVAIGKGIQLQSESSFVDNRNEIPVLRPMREFTSKEITFYVIWKKLDFIVQKNLVSKTDLKSNIQRMTETFVNSLEADFPSTVYTIFKTSNKLEDLNESQLKCIICNSSIDTSNRPKCSAFEALILTQKLSNDDSYDSESSPQSPAMTGLSDHNNELCYGCALIANDMIKTDQKFPKFMLKKDLKSDIKDFLLEEDNEEIH